MNEVSNASANEAHWMKQFDAPASAVGDFDRDGVLEIVAHNDNQYLYVVSSTGARVLAEIRPDYPSGWPVRPINDPKVADVDGDGRLDIVVVNSAAVVCVYEYQSGSSTTSMSFSKEWCRRMDAYDGGSAAADGGPAVGDVNGDGKLEIFAQTEKLGLFAYNWDGSTRWSKNTYGGNAGPILADLSNDGSKDVVFFGDGGEVKAFDASSGTSRWGFWASNHVKPASIPIAGNAADLDHDGKMEVVFSARHAPPGDTNYYDNHLMIFVLSSSGSLRAHWQPSGGNPMSYTHPVLIDVDGDGDRDILLQDWNTIGHKPGDWEKLGPANVFAYTRDGALLWRTVMDNTWSNDDLAVADVDGDGKQEVLTIGYGPGGDGVWALDLRTGAKETHTPVGSWTALRGPFAADLGGDGKTWWAISVHSSAKGGAIQVYRTGAACNIAWGGWAVPKPCAGGSGGGGSAPPPPPPSGDLQATFTPTAGNAWWIQVKVSSNHPLAGVDARVDGGPWHPLDLKSWGDWANSIHAPDGAVVQFQARSTSGATATSGCYQWTARNAVGCGGSAPPPPPPSGGSVTFTPVTGNEWWIQVKVSGSGIHGVDARVDGGAWEPLTLRNWGDWAASVHAPDGSIVQFQARTTSGTALSGCYQWTSRAPTSCAGGSPPPPSGGSFSATFQNVRGNTWWIETDVATSGGALAGVDARVGSGAWTALEPQSWGSWAKSTHAPAGSTVTFRARATDGQTATSGAYAWPP